MKRLSLYFTAPGEITLEEEEIPPLQPNQVLVQTLLTAISPGTELLIYRGQFPGDLPTDETISSLAGQFAYPAKYGYCAVGQVVEAGSPAVSAWAGRLVFSFQPHHSHFTAAVEELMPLPEGVSVDDSVFLPNMETAVNFIMDGAPAIGEQVLVFGQGIVGLLTSGVLSRFPLALLVTLDRYPKRRAASIALGAHHSLDPFETGIKQKLEALLPVGADLAYELSGSPAALDQALGFTGYEGRVVIGSWYGQKRASLDLGGRFHRSRIRLISSQVSTLASGFMSRWSKQRRFEVAWEMIRAMQPARWITQRFPISQAAQAYRLIDEHPEETIQVVLHYGEV
jgi:2-desacetyl-2-hydroxyethyl bacteriochlorophyllide A dehydrogenase